MSLLATAESIIEKYKSGKMSKSEATARLTVAARKETARAMKQSENSNLPTTVRMGVAKKGYTRQLNA